jgi:microcin C transport system substrate-binding protein
LRLFREAGWEVKDQKLTNVKTGEKMQIEVLLSQPTFERIVSFWKPLLERVGVEVSIRVVDATQYENRQRSWDFDVILASWGQSLSPGNEQRGFWGSKAADQAGSRNFVGIRDAAVDSLIDRVVFAKNRTELVAATKALDRVLLANHFVVPQWTYGKVRTARWDRFGKPDPLPKYGMAAFPTVWWWDAEKAAKVGSRS